MNKGLKRIVKGSLVMLAIGLYLGNQNKIVRVFELDAVSAATDGSECTNPAWIGCSVGWLEKGYVFDTGKGYYVKTSSSTTKVTTTKPITTTKPVVITTKIVANTTKPGSTTAPTTTTTVIVSDTKTQQVTTLAPPTGKNEVGGKTTYTNRPRNTSVTQASTTTKPVDVDFMSAIPLPWVAGGLGAMVVMIIEFFIVRAMYKQD